MIPWKQIIVVLPEVAKAARAAMRYWESREPAPLDPNAPMETRVEALQRRIAVLEDNERKQAEVLGQIVDQLQGIAAGLEEVAARQRYALALAAAAAVAALAALVISLTA